MRKQLVILFAVVILTTACSPIARQEERLATSSARQSKDITYTPVNLSAPLPLHITQDSPVIELPAGKSYVAALRLPKSNGPRKLLLKTHRVGIAAENSQVFCPQITFLNDHFETISSTGEATLWYEPPGFVTNGFWYTVADLPHAADYAVVHTPSHVIGRLISVSGDSSPGYAFYNGSSYIYVPGDSSPSYPCGQIGKIEVEVR